MRTHQAKTIPDITDGFLTYQAIVQELLALQKRNEQTEAAEENTSDSEKALALQGTKVILSACESDLVAGNFGLTDEHLSLASAFLGDKKASEVMGALFSCSPDVSRELILKARECPDKPLYHILQEKQRDWVMEDNWEKEKPYSKIAAFRVMGFPCESSPDKK